MEQTKGQNESTKQMERQGNMTQQEKAYLYSKRCLDVKMEAMEIILRRIRELDGLIDKQGSDEKLKTLSVIAQLGAAVIPD